MKSATFFGIFAFLLLGLNGFSSGCSSERAQNKLVLPKDVQVDELLALIPTASLPPGFAESRRGPFIAGPGGASPGDLPPSVLVVFTDDSGNRLSFAIAVLAADADVERYADVYDRITVEGPTPGGPPTLMSCKPNSTGPDHCAYKRTSAGKVGEQSISFESTVRREGRVSRVDMFTRSGVYASLMMDVMDEAMLKSRPRLLKAFDSRIRDLVAEKGVTD